MHSLGRTSVDIAMQYFEWKDGLKSKNKVDAQFLKGRYKINSIKFLGVTRSHKRLGGKKLTQI